MLVWNQPRHARDLPGYKEANYWTRWSKFARPWHETWKAWKIYRYRRGQKYLDRIDIKKSVGGVNIYIRVYPNKATKISMNGTLVLNEGGTTFEDILSAIEEARQHIGL